MTPYSLPALNLFSLLVYCVEAERVLRLVLVFSVVTSDMYVELGSSLVFRVRGPPTDSFSGNLANWLSSRRSHFVISRVPL